MNPKAPNSDAYLAAVQRVRDTATRAVRTRIVDLFEREPQRLQRFSLQAAGLHLDLSKQLIDEQALDALLELAASAQVESRRDAQLRGERVNRTENRAVLHTALRRDPARSLVVDGIDLMHDVGATVKRMGEFARSVRDGDWLGSDGRAITDVVSIGIGGSQLGPEMACRALREFASQQPRVHFLANIDPGSWNAIRDRLEPRSTLVIVASKSWRTAETARNAQAVRDWLLEAGVTHAQLARHLVGVTANVQGARDFGLADEAIFPFWDWVGGRFSMWSAIGLPVMLAIGAQNFQRMLEGARQMDEHFATAALADNAPVLLALVTFWNRLAIPGASEPVIPYCDALSRLPAYLQQLQMESNGKSVDDDGEPLTLPTIPVIWGEPGTDAQHSFFQALHQGTSTHPVEFVVAIPSRRDAGQRDLGLLANALAQAEALMRGRNRQDSESELLATGMPPEQAGRLAAHRVHPGNRPSSTILLGELSPESFGALIALYEHKTAVLGWLWRINSYDQWGVELGKKLAERAEQVLAGISQIPAGTDPSTADLVTRVRTMLAARDA